MNTRRKIFKFIGLLMAVAMLLAVLPDGHVVAQTTHTVCPVGCDFTTIQAAINAASGGDIITVEPAIYVGDIVIDKSLSLMGAGREDVTIGGVANHDPGALNIIASDVTVDGFTIQSAGRKTVRISSASNDVTFTNNKVIAASAPPTAADWTAFETTGTQTDHVIDNNIFVGDASSQLLYFNPDTVNLQFTNNTLEGSVKPGGLVLGFEGLDGDQDISGNTFDIESDYALLELFGIFDVLETFEANTFPDGFIPSQNKVVEDTQVFPSTNDDNRDQGWAHVNKVIGNILESTITLEFVSARNFWSCFEYRTDGDTAQKIGDNNFNTEIADGLYPYYCQNNSSRVEAFAVDQYVEVRLSFGGEKDERFTWTRFDLTPELWVCETGECGYPGYEFASIQDAIDAADIGSVIHVYPGTYGENLTIYKEGLSIKGPYAGVPGYDDSRNPEAIIEGNVKIDASGVTLDGFTILSGGETWAVDITARDVLVQYNIIDGQDDTGRYAIGAGGAKGRQVYQYNHIKNFTAGDGGPFDWSIFLDGDTDNSIQIHGNIFENNKRGVIFSGSLKSSAEGVREVTDNIFTETGIAIVIGSDSTDVIGNFIENGNGVYVIGNNNYFAFNTFDQTTGYAVYFGGNHIDNALFCNSIWSPLYNVTVNTTVDAIGNYWGSVYGPGVGQIVGDGDVIYEPWSGDAACSFFLPAPEEQIDAVDDMYDAVVNDVLTVPAPGVLENDLLDSPAGGYTAKLVTDLAEIDGTLVWAEAEDGSFTYTPPADWTGTTTFEYVACDADQLCSLPATVTIDTRIGAVDDAYFTLIDQKLVVSATNGVLANDFGPEGETLTASILTYVDEGVLSFMPNGGFSYEPPAGWEGQATFTYEACGADPDFCSLPATVMITVAAEEPAPTPVAVDDAYETLVNEALIVEAPGVLDNDTAPEGEALTAELVKNIPLGMGSLRLDADGGFEYQPPANWIGETSFDYRACLVSDPQVCSEPATVTITVAAEEPASLPVAVDDAYETPFNEALIIEAPGVLDNDIAPEGEMITAELVTNIPLGMGSLRLDADGGLEYQPPTDWSGEVSFTYQACLVSDPGMCSEPATVTITVMPGVVYSYHFPLILH